MSDTQTRLSKDVSSAFLKTLAMGLMLLNHTTDVLFETVFPAADTAELVFVIVTRASFIIFAFLTAEGLRMTSSRPKYFLRMAVFALISEPFFDLCFSGTFFDPSYQNVFFTHALAIIGVSAEEKLREATGSRLSTAILILPPAAALLLRCDYSLFGVAVIYLFYYFWKKDVRLTFVLLAVSCFTLLPLFLGLERLIFGTGAIDAAFFNTAFASAAVESAGLLILPLIEAYDGRRGRQINKYFYYAVYPAHLLLLGLLRFAVTRAG